MTTEPKQMIAIDISAPGSSGYLNKELTQEQTKFLLELAEEWNEKHPLTSQPFISITTVPQQG